MWKFSYPCLLICRRIVLNQILSYLKMQKTREEKRLKNAKKCHSSRLARRRGRAMHEVLMLKQPHVWWGHFCKLKISFLVVVVVVLAFAIMLQFAVEWVEGFRRSVAKYTLNSSRLGTRSFDHIRSVRQHLWFNLLNQLRLGLKKKVSLINSLLFDGL